MVSRLLVRVSESPRLERLVSRNRLSRRVALQFIAGEELSDGLDAAAELAGAGRSASLDYVGEHVRDTDDAKAAADTYRETLDGIADRRLDAGISVKPTQLGLVTYPDLCAELLDGVAERAAAIGAHVTLDMEDSTVTEATVALVERMRRAGHEHVGCAVQAALHRTEDDVVRLSESGASLRLCKGAYAEPPHLAYQARPEVDAAFRRNVSLLLEVGTYPRFATHDDRVIEHVKSEAARLGRSADGFEFQLLYGVRPELQGALVAEGYRVCVYVPFGRNWYAYFMRRLAERPANVLFLMRALGGAATRSRRRSLADRPTSSSPNRPNQRAPEEGS